MISSNSSYIFARIVYGNDVQPYIEKLLDKLHAEMVDLAQIYPNAPEKVAPVNTKIAFLQCCSSNEERLLKLLGMTTKQAHAVMEDSFKDIERVYEMNGLRLSPVPTPANIMNYLFHQTAAIRKNQVALNKKRKIIALYEQGVFFQEIKELETEQLNALFFSVKLRCFEINETLCLTPADIADPEFTRAHEHYLREKLGNQAYRWHGWEALDSKKYAALENSDYEVMVKEFIRQEFKAIIKKPKREAKKLYELEKIRGEFLDSWHSFTYDQLNDPKLTQVYFEALGDGKPYRLVVELEEKEVFDWQAGKLTSEECEAIVAQRCKPDVNARDVLSAVPEDVHGVICDFLSDQGAYAAPNLDSLVVASKAIADKTLTFIEKFQKKHEQDVYHSVLQPIILDIQAKIEGSKDKDVIDFNKIKLKFFQSERLHYLIKQGIADRNYLENAAKELKTLETPERYAPGITAWENVRLLEKGMLPSEEKKMRRQLGDRFMREFLSAYCRYGARAQELHGLSEAQIKALYVASGLGDNGELFLTLEQVKAPWFSDHHARYMTETSGWSLAANGQKYEVAKKLTWSQAAALAWIETPGVRSDDTIKAKDVRGASTFNTRLWRSYREKYATSPLVEWKSHIKNWKEEGPDSDEEKEENSDDAQVSCSIS